jgi:hypothetical protein
VLSFDPAIALRPTIKTDKKLPLSEWDGTIDSLNTGVGIIYIYTF